MGVPVPRDIGAAAYPDFSMAFKVVDKPLQGADTSGPADQEGLEAGETPNRETAELDS